MSAVLAVICLSVILLSSEAHAQSTVDETTSCGASTTLEQVATVINLIAANQQENSNQIKKEI